jgi:hypothetical protein
MAASKGRALGQEDLDRAIRSVALHFNTDIVFVIGSQALLVGRADVARELRYSNEFDMYPALASGSLPAGVEASETIHALFGEGPQFHETHGFFIDGVDETTARLPADWRDRAIERQIKALDGKPITAIAPAPAEVVAAKLVRGDQKDIEFASLCIRYGLVKSAEIKRALSKTLNGPELAISLRRVDAASRSQAPNDISG